MRFTPHLRALVLSAIAMILGILVTYFHTGPIIGFIMHVIACFAVFAGFKIYSNAILNVIFALQAGIVGMIVNNMIGMSITARWVDLTILAIVYFFTIKYYKW